MLSIATEEYEFIRQLVYKHSRINLGNDKTELVARRVQKRLRALNLKTFQDYCEYLKSHHGDGELTDLLDVISTNVTEFFREIRHFDYLQSTVLPAWHKSHNTSGSTYRVWSAACSSGEEPYSLAILLAEHFKQQSHANWQVEASDISTRMLDTAKQAIYRAEKVKMPKPEWVSRYFQRGTGQFEGFYRVKKDIRDHVTFHHVNLFQSSYPVASNLDAIFCRNVMIYFDRPTQEQLVSRLAAQLAPGGILFVGHSESLISIHHKLRSLQPSVYQKT